MQFKFLGWILNEKFATFYAWTSNANQGQGGQVVLAGNFNYTFNKYLNLAIGLNGLPGTRTLEGNFPFWLGVDARLIADEYFRPSYTSGIWARGQFADRLSYQAMVGNNMSTLGVSAAQIDNGLNTVSIALVWTPTGDFSRGFSGQGFGDFENHDKFSTRLAVHYSRSDENKEAQSSTNTFENTQLRLSDGSVIFTPNLFGPGITVEDATWRMSSFDGGFKYHGFSLEGEYYLRWINNFRGPGTEGLKEPLRPRRPASGLGHGHTKILQVYAGHSRYLRSVWQALGCPGGLTGIRGRTRLSGGTPRTIPVQVAGRIHICSLRGRRKGFVFHTSVELAF